MSEWLLTSGEHQSQMSCYVGQFQINQRLNTFTQTHMPSLKLCFSETKFEARHVWGCRPTTQVVAVYSDAHQMTALRPGSVLEVQMIWVEA